MKIINFSTEDQYFEAFKDCVARHGCTVPQVLRAAVRSFGEGKLILQGAYLVPVGVSQEPQARPVGRPPTKQQEPEKKPTSNDPWERVLENANSIWDFKMYNQPHPDVDPKPRLQLNTMGDITNKSFDYLLSELYYETRHGMDERHWRVVKFPEYVACCAMKFFALNKTSALYFDIDAIQAELDAFLDEMESKYPGWISWREKGGKYVEEQANDI